MSEKSRALHEMRQVTFERDVSRHAEGSCLVSFGHTKVLCTVSVEDKVPFWLKGGGAGWVSAEYGMLPRSTHSRKRREAGSGKQDGRSLEIQRLIGRSLRAVTNLQGLGERQLIVDCDVLQADGGTRTAAISGAWLALYDACLWLHGRGLVNKIPLKDHLAAVSVGIVGGEVMVDLDYEADSSAETDLNLVMTGKGGLVEIQGTAEKDPFSEAQLGTMLSLGRAAINGLVDQQKAMIAR